MFEFVVTWVCRAAVGGVIVLFVVVGWKILMAGPLLPSMAVGLWRSEKDGVSTLIGKLPDGRRIEIEALDNDNPRKPSCIMRIGEWRSMLELDLEWKEEQRKKAEEKRARRGN